MSPTLATILTIVGVLYLLHREAAHGETRSPALWLPFMWLCITGSRFVSQWMDLGAGGGDNVTEGSAIDATYFALLIVAAFWVLRGRNVSVGAVVAVNYWLAALVLYGLFSILWSDFPLTAGKRWIKTLGHPLMALVILSEPDPVAAVRTVLKRCAFFLLPVSVLFIKYLPEYGRGFDAWSGMAINNGVGLTKNDLGYLCMVFGIVFIWDLLTLRRIADRKTRWVEAGLSIVFIWMAVWLLFMSNSMTSLATMLLGVAVMVGLGWPIVSKRFFGTFVVLILVVGFTLESAFNLYEQIVLMLGRNPSLTDRTVVWTDVLAMQQQPIFGYGFESFWLGDRLDLLWQKWWWRPTQAHNGYIETYLSLGLIGVVLLVAVLLSTFRRISHQLQTDFDFARLRMALLLAIILFNYTEAAFKAVHFIWTVFYIIAMELPRHTLRSKQQVGSRA